MSSKVRAILLFVFCFGLSYLYFFNINAPIASYRDPASTTSKVTEIDNLSVDEIKAQLQNKIKVAPTIAGMKTISFSEFSANLCKTYATIELEFWAEGVSVSGEAPTMKVSTPCEKGVNSDEMAAINLPIEKILKERPRNAQFSFDGFHATVVFSNSADEWPMQWVLKKVEFKNANGSAENKAVSFGRFPASAEEPPIVLEF